MGRRPWHKAPSRMHDDAFLSLTPTARCAVKCIDELLADDPVLVGNVSRIGGWIGLDRKQTREALAAIEAAKVLSITREDRGKAGVFYTIWNPNRPLDRIPNYDPTQDPNLDPIRNPTQDPNRAPHKSAIDEDLGNSSLNRGEEKRGDKKRGEPPLSPSGGAGAEAPADGEVFLTLQAKDGTLVPITAAQVDEWQSSLPGLAVEAELRKAANWHAAATTQQKKTARGMSKFLYAWLLRAAEKAANAPQRSPAQVLPPPGGIVGNGGRSVFDLYQMRAPSTQEAG